jgi:hypothetical protein
MHQGLVNSTVRSTAEAALKINQPECATTERPSAHNTVKAAVPSSSPLPAGQQAEVLLDALLMVRTLASYGDLRLSWLHNVDISIPVLLLLRSNQP